MPKISVTEVYCPAYVHNTMKFAFSVTFLLNLAGTYAL